MRDLNSPDTYRKNNSNEFDKIQKRVITSNEWDNKLEEIKEWQEEQERLKHREVEDGLGPALDYTEEVNMSPEEMSHQMQSTKRTQYAIEVDNIRQELGINQNATFGPASMGIKQKKGNFVTRWLMFGRAGKNLSTLEIENNKKLLDSVKDNTGGSLLGGMMSQGTSIKEKPEQQEFRMNVEDWNTYLYFYRLTLYISILSLVVTILNVGFLFVPGIYPLITSLGMLGFASYQLLGFEDGPIKGNFFGTSQNLEAYQKSYKEQSAQSKDNSSNQTQSNSNPYNFDFNTGGSSESGSSAYPDFMDTDDTDDFQNADDILGDIDDSSSDEDYSEDYSEEVPDEPETTNHFRADDNFVDDGKTIPQSYLNVKDGQELARGEEEFLKMIYRNRATLSKNLNRPYDILKTFAPLIANFNDDFADVKEISRNSWAFKNIAYLIGTTYNQISSTFKNASIGENAEYNPDYYFFIDKIEETGLFYKIQVRLPNCVSRDNVLKNLETMKGNLRRTDGDVVDISTDLPNNIGSFKIFKITTSDSGSSFMPLVSTGDVLRFKNMKTTTGKNLIEQLNAPDDLNILFGLSDAENALVLDIAGSQNTSIAVAGFTGSGKSASTGSWLANLLVTHSPDELGIIILDPKKGSFWDNMKYAPHVLGCFNNMSDAEKAPALVSILKTNFAARQTHLGKDVGMKNYYEARRYFKKHEDWERLKTVPRLLFIMDEQKDLISALKTLDDGRKQENNALKKEDKLYANFYDSYNTQVGALANVIREGGISIMTISQRTENNSIPRSLLGASSIKFIMKSPFSGDVDRMLGENQSNPNMSNAPTGSGYLVANGLNLTQLTTPLFSGEPGRLEELVRMISLAWVILYDYQHDISKEAPYFYLSESSKTHVETMKKQQIDVFNIFNRDENFETAKKILRGDLPLHFGPDYGESNFKLDLDKPSSEQEMEELRVPEADNIRSESESENEIETDDVNDEKINEEKDKIINDIDSDIKSTEDSFVKDDNSQNETQSEPTLSERSLREGLDKLNHSTRVEPDLPEDDTQSEPTQSENYSEYADDDYVSSNESEPVSDDVQSETAQSEDVQDEVQPRDDVQSDFADKNVSLSELIKKHRLENENQPETSNIEDETEGQTNNYNENEPEEQSDSNQSHEVIDEDVSSEFADYAHRNDYEKEYMEEAMKHENSEGEPEVDEDEHEFEETPPKPTSDKFNSSEVIDGEFSEIKDNSEPDNSTFSESESEPVQDEINQDEFSQGQADTGFDYPDTVEGLLNYFNDNELMTVPNDEILKLFSKETVFAAIDKKVVSVDRRNRVKLIYK